MLPVQRREKILDLIKEDGHAKVLQLSKIFKVTEVTIRQDLEKLEKDGFIEREHGGAYLKDVGVLVKNISLQNQQNLEEKASIARKAVEYIHNGDTIILDSGSTTTEIAKQITGFKNLTVIT
ncbi:MAG TPA: DeoR/GlpR family DNA-binding transcription regulator, partial [Bacteroidales bacterium]|nr:DeoR/GlpR family DNA-binding transcription regulator [Bacteroidales bacterium]